MGHRTQTSLLSAVLVSLKAKSHADDVAFLPPGLLVATDAPVRFVGVHYMASADYGIFSLPLPRGEGHHQGPEDNDTR